MVLPAILLLLLIVCGTNKCIDVNDHDIKLDVFWVIEFSSYLPMQNCIFFTNMTYRMHCNFEKAFDKTTSHLINRIFLIQNLENIVKSWRKVLLNMETIL